MVRLGRKLAIAPVLMGIALWAVASPAQAEPVNPRFQIQFYEDNVLTLTVIDNTVLPPPGQGSDAQSGVGGTGIISFSGTVGDFSVSITNALENGTPSPIPNPPNLPPPPAILQIGTVAINNNGSTAHTLTIITSSQDFTVPASPPPLLVTSTAAGSVASGTLTATFQSYADAGNALFGTSFPVGLQGPFVRNTAQSYHDDASLGGFASGALYSLTNRGDYTISGGGQVTQVGGNTETFPVPEPGSLALVLAGLPFLSAAWLRRRGK